MNHAFTGFIKKTKMSGGVNVLKKIHYRNLLQSGVDSSNVTCELVTHG